MKNDTPHPSYETIVSAIEALPYGDPAQEPLIETDVRLIVRVHDRYQSTQLRQKIKEFNTRLIEQALRDGVMTIDPETDHISIPPLALRGMIALAGLNGAAVTLLAKGKALDEVHQLELLFPPHEETPPEVGN